MALMASSQPNMTLKYFSSKLYKIRARLLYSLGQIARPFTTPKYSRNLQGNKTLIYITNYLVGVLKRRERIRAQLGFLMEEVLERGDKLPEWKIIHTKRERNGVAHELAQLARRTRHSVVWRFAAPTWVEHIIA